MISFFFFEPCGCMPTKLRRKRKKMNRKKYHFPRKMGKSGAGIFSSPSLASVGAGGLALGVGPGACSPALEYASTDVWVSISCLRSSPKVHVCDAWSPRVGVWTLELTQLLSQHRLLSCHYRLLSKEQRFGHQGLWVTD